MNSARKQCALRLNWGYDDYVSLLIYREFEMYYEVFFFFFLICFLSFVGVCVQGMVVFPLTENSQRQCT